MDERNRIQLNPKPNSQRTISSREYRNFGLGAGAPGSAASNGRASEVATAGASKMVIGFVTGKTGAPLAANELTKYALGVELATRPGSIFALSFASGAAGSCAGTTLFAGLLQK